MSDKKRSYETERKGKDKLVALAWMAYKPGEADRHKKPAASACQNRNHGARA